MSFSVSVICFITAMVCVTDAGQISPMLSTMTGSYTTFSWLPGGDASLRVPNKTKSNPLPRSAVKVLIPSLWGHTMQIVSARTVIVSGGWIANRGVLNDQLYYFDMMVRKWYMNRNLFNLTASAQPVARTHHVSWYAAGLYGLHGGWDVNQHILQDTWQLKNNTWSRFTRVPAPPRLAGHTATLTTSDNVLVFGGYTGATTPSISNALWQFNARNQSWSFVKTMGVVAPTARAYHATCTLTGTADGVVMIIMGGEGTNGLLSDVWSYILEKGIWIQRFAQPGPFTRITGEPVPAISVAARSKHSCVSISGIRMMCSGGFSGEIYEDFVEYDYDLNRWLRTPTINVPPRNRVGITMVSAPHGVLYLLGGVDVLTRTTPSTVFSGVKYTPPRCPKGWVSPDGDYKCFRCPKGSTSSSNGYQCNVCGIGTYLTKDGTTCALCPKGTYNPSNGTSNITSCLPCPVGTFGARNGGRTIDDCVRCPPGTYNDEVKASTCKSCPAGSYGFAFGATTWWDGCQPCDYGRYSFPGATGCTLCPAGTTSGAFARRLDPYALQIFTWGTDAQTNTLTSQFSNCAARTLSQASTIVAGKWFWVVVIVNEYGTDGMNGLMLTSTLVSGLTATVMKNGGGGQMMYNCFWANDPATCSTVADGVMTPPINIGSSNGCMWSHYFVFGLRFDQVSTNTELTFFSGSLLSTSVTLLIRGNRLTVKQQPPSLILFGDSFDIAVAATDKAGNVDIVESNNAHISIACDVAGVVMSVFGDTRGVTHSNSLSFADGVAPATIQIYPPTSAGFQTDISCTFTITHAVTSSMTVTTTSVRIQTPARMLVSLLSLRVGIGADFRLDARVVDYLGANMEGDRVSMFSVSLPSSSPYQLLPASGYNLQGTAIGGIASFWLKLFPKFKLPKLTRRYAELNTTSLIVKYLSPFTIVNTSVTVRVRPVTKLNATRIIVLPLDPSQYGNSYAQTSIFSSSTIVANRTYTVALAAVDDGGAIDPAANFRITVGFAGCTARVIYMNKTRRMPLTYFPRLFRGRVTFQLKVRGSGVCRVMVYEHSGKIYGGYSGGYGTQKTHAFPSVTIVRVTHVVLSSCSPPCASACTVSAGVPFTITATLMIDNSNTALTTDNVTIIRVTSSVPDNVVDADDNGFWRRVNKGVATFRLTAVPSASKRLTLTFEAGDMKLVQYFDNQVEADPMNLGVPKLTSTKMEQVRFFRDYDVRSIITCPLGVRTVATKLIGSETVPSWIPSGSPFTVHVQAVDDRGIIDDSVNGAITVTITKCEVGSISPQWYYIVSGTKYALAGTSNQYTMTAGRATIQLAAIILYSRRVSGENRGVVQCEVRFSVGSLSGLWSGFEIVRLAPSCDFCAMGSWSPGGDATGAVSGHPGGCVPCMVGTYSTSLGATSEQQCNVCPSSTGYNTNDGSELYLEGVIQCSSCSGGRQNTIVQVGPCPSAYIGVYGISVVHSGGRIGRVCTLSRCQDCGAGRYYVDCPTLSSANCVSKSDGKCTWDGTACQGPNYVCVDCPAGTVQPNSVNLGSWSSCLPCAGGVYSSAKALSTRTFLVLEPYNCIQSSTLVCTGAGTGTCPAGTYAPTTMLTSVSQCLPCPAGTYGPLAPYYSSGCTGSCSVRTNTYCAAGCTCTSNIAGYTGRTYCLKCPPGTYNPNNGSIALTDCIPCPSGYYCPLGTGTPIAADPISVKQQLVLQQILAGYDVDTSILPAVSVANIVKPSGVAFDGSTERYSCSSNNIDAEGFVNDGHITQYFLRYKSWPDYLSGGYTQYWKLPSPLPLSGKEGFQYNTLDHSGITSSGSFRINVTCPSPTYRSPTISQVMNLKHTNTIVFLARAWIRLDAYRVRFKYPSYIRSVGVPHIGVRWRMYRTNDTSVVDFEKKVSLPWNRTAPKPTRWELLVTKLSPGFPVWIATVELFTENLCQGEVYYDDISLKPDVKIMCNCSTGYYYNMSRTYPDSCQICPPGSYCSGGTRKSCSDVQYAGAGLVTCNYCPDGWLCNEDGRGTAVPCPQFYYKVSDYVCAPCPLGYRCESGKKYICPWGTYGDGGATCTLCQPGYVSRGEGSPQCTRCRPGFYSNAMRTKCLPCKGDHFSPDGMACRSCPENTFVWKQSNGTECNPCRRAIPAVSKSVSRNSVNNVIPVIPNSCLTANDFRVERVDLISTITLGSIRVPRNVPLPSIKFDSGATLGVAVYKVTVTADEGVPAQIASLSINVINNAPIANDETVYVDHTCPSSFYITTILENDRDIDGDDLYVESVVVPPEISAVAAVTVHTLQVSGSRSLRLKCVKSFQQTSILYRVMDAKTSNCVAPDCLVSNYARVTIITRGVPPVALNEIIQVLSGTPSVVDILANDVDADGDPTRAALENGGVTARGVTAVLRSECASCTGSCANTPSCTCSTDALTSTCVPSTGPLQRLVYTPPFTMCGRDSIQYKVSSNDGVSDLATTTFQITNCFCNGRAVGMDIFILIDGSINTVNAVNWQIAFAKGLQQRAQLSSNMYFSVIQTGSTSTSVVYPLTNTAFSTSFITPLDSPSFEMYLGLDAIVAHKLSNGNAARTSVVVVLAGHTPPSSIETQLKSMGAQGYEFVAISYDPSSSDFVTNMFDGKATWKLTDAASLVTPTVVVQVMDYICPL